MNNNTIANITIDELHEYVTIMASKIAKMTVEENSVITGTIANAEGSNYIVQLATSNSQVNAQPLTAGIVYNKDDYVYLIKGAASIEGGESPNYFIFGRVDDTKVAFANASDLERFTGQDEYTLTSSSPSLSSSVTFERGSNEDEPIFWTRLKNYKALKIEGNFTTVDNVGVTVTYNYADGTKEEFKLDATWMQGQPNNMNSLYQARVIERTKALIDGDTVTVSMVGSTSVTLTAGTLNKYLKDFSLEVKPTNKSYFRNELPEKERDDTVRLEARLKYLDGAINSGVQYYWFVEMPEGVTAEDLADADKDQVNDLIGGDRWYCLNSYNDCNVVGQTQKIRIWNKSDNFIQLDKFNYLHKVNEQNVFSFDSLNQIPFKFINKIKCVAEYEGFYINSEVFELVDYSKESFTIEISANEPDLVLITEDSEIILICEVKQDNEMIGKDKFSYSYLWLINGASEFTVKKGTTDNYTEEKVQYTQSTLKLKDTLSNIYADNTYDLTSKEIKVKCKVFIDGLDADTESDYSEESNELIVTSFVLSESTINEYVFYKYLISNEVNETFTSELDNNGYLTWTPNGSSSWVSDDEDELADWTGNTSNWPLNGKTGAAARDYLNTIIFNSNNSYLYYTTKSVWIEEKLDYELTDDQRYIKIKEGDWSLPRMLRGVTENGNNLSEGAVNKINTFNDLTNGGKEQGFYLKDVYYPTEDKTPQSGKTYYLLDGDDYVEQTDLQSFLAGKIYYEYEPSKLFINAEFIQTGALRVADPNGNSIFYADIGQNKVEIGGFTVDSNSISNNKRYSYTQISDDDKSKDPVSDVDYYTWDGNNYEKCENLSAFAADTDYFTRSLHSQAVYIGQDNIQFGSQFNYDVSSGELDITGIEADYLIIKNDDESKSTAFYASNDDTKKPDDVPEGVKVYAQNLASISGQMGTLTAGKINGGTSQQHFQYYNWQTEEAINNIWDDENEYYVLQLDDMVIDESGALRRITLTAGSFNNFNKPILIPSEITKSDGNIRSITSIQGSYSLFDDPEVAEQIIGLKIAEGITSIGQGGLCAKASFLNLKTIILPSSLTEIANSALTGWGGGLLYLSQGMAKTTQIASAAFSLISGATDTIILCEDNSPGKKWQTDWIASNSRPPLKTIIEYGYYSQEERKSEREGVFYWTKDYTRSERVWTISTEGPQFIQSTNFSLSHRGDIIANNGIFSGKLQGATGSFSGDLIAKKGQIANFTIDEKQLSTKNLSLSDDGISFLSSQASLKLASTSLSSENNKVTLNINKDIFEITGKTTALKFQSDAKQEKSYPLHLKIESGYLNEDGDRFEDYQFNDGWGLAMPSYKLTLTTTSKEDWLIYPHIVNIPFTVTFSNYWGSIEVLKEGTLAFKFNSKDTKTVSVYTPTTVNLAKLTLTIYSVDPSSATSHSVRFSPDTEAGTLNISSYYILPQVDPGATIRCQADFLPATSANGPGENLSPGWDLGDNEAWWRDAYVRDHPTGGSDQNLKKNIVGLHNQIILNKFFDLLQPVSYQWIDGTSGRTHFGLIAQDVKSALLEVGLTTQDVAAYCEWEKEDGSIGCGLRYGEFIALCIDQIQKLKKEVSSLKEELKEIKGE